MRNRPAASAGDGGSGFSLTFFVLLTYQTVRGTKNRFYTLRAHQLRSERYIFKKWLKLRAGIAFLMTSTHLTSVARQIWVAFWGEQQAVVGIRRDGLYFSAPSTMPDSKCPPQRAQRTRVCQQELSTRLSGRRLPCSTSMRVPVDTQPLYFLPFSVFLSALCS